MFGVGNFISGVSLTSAVDRTFSTHFDPDTIRLEYFDYEWKVMTTIDFRTEIASAALKTFMYEFEEPLELSAVKFILSNTSGTEGLKINKISLYKPPQFVLENNTDRHDIFSLTQAMFIKDTNVYSVTTPPTLVSDLS